MPSPTELLFGKIAVMNKMATTAQIEECIQLQGMFAQTGMEMTLGEVLLKKKYMTQQQVDQVLKAQQFLELRNEDVRFGEIAVSNGFATKEQVAESLVEQELAFRKGLDPPRIGQVLLQKQYVNQQQIIACLKAQARLAATPPPAPPKTPATQAARPVPPPAPVPQTRQGTTRTPTRELPAVGAAPPAAETEAPAALPEGLEPSLNVDGCMVNTHAVRLSAPSGREKTIIVLEIEGNLDGHTFPYFDEYLGGFIEAGCGNVVIHCGQMEYISSAGIGVLVGAAKRCRDLNGDIRLCAVPPNIRQIIQLLGFHNLIRIYDAERGAVASFKYM